MPIMSAVLLTAATPGFAQVTVDLHALQALPERSTLPERPGASHRTAPTPDAQAVKPNPPPVATRTTPAARPEAPPPAAQPVLPETQPEIASIAPITPSAPPAGPPPPPPVTADAATEAAPTSSGLRLTFAPGQSDLSPDSNDSIKQLTQSAPAGDATTFNVLAYAPGKPDDPSTARRVSLSRAMAVRSALVADGIPSARIFVRALGEQHGDGPPDRVDVSVIGTNPQSERATSR
jgi:outer membrane protein OmpA-like peptidoglycan-associated protein